jgi:hypothetical protein
MLMRGHFSCGPEITSTYILKSFIKLNTELGPAHFEHTGPLIDSFTLLSASLCVKVSEM